MKYDTTQGRFDGTFVEVKEGGFEVNGKFARSAEGSRTNRLSDGVEIVLEQLGFFAKKELPKTRHPGGAKKVVSHCSW